MRGTGGQAASGTRHGTRRGEKRTAGPFFVPAGRDFAGSSLRFDKTPRTPGQAAVAHVRMRGTGGQAASGTRRGVRRMTATFWAWPWPWA